MAGMWCLCGALHQPVGFLKCVHRSWQAWCQWPLYLQFAIPSYLMISFEWVRSVQIANCAHCTFTCHNTCAPHTSTIHYPTLRHTPFQWLFDVLAVMTGLLPNPDQSLATMGIASTLSALGYMLPLGLADAVVTLVSNELGAGNHRAARRAVKVAVSLALGAQCVQAATLLLLRGHIGRLWTSDVQVLASVKHVLVPTALSMAGDGVCAVIGGVCLLAHGLTDG